MRTVHQQVKELHDKLHIRCTMMKSGVFFVAWTNHVLLPFVVEGTILFSSSELFVGFTFLSDGLSKQHHLDSPIKPLLAYIKNLSDEIFFW